MPRNAFPFARHPIEGVPHGTAIAIGPSPFSGSKGRRNNNPPTEPEAGMLIWLDANDIASLWQDSAGTVPVTANNDPVGRWTTTEASATDHMDQALNNAFRPLYKTNILNGKPGVKFDGSNDYLDQDGIFTAARMNESTTFMVISGWTTGTYQGLLGASADPGETDTFYLRVTDISKTEVLESYVGNSMTSTAAVSTSGAVIGFKFSDSGNSYTHYSGRSANGTGSTTSTFSQPTDILGAQLGAGPEYYSGYIHEFIVYDSVLNATKTDNVLWYLQNKWLG
jgi:hypothetical protein